MWELCVLRITSFFGKETSYCCCYWRYHLRALLLVSDVSNLICVSGKLVFALGIIVLVGIVSKKKFMSIRLSRVFNALKHLSRHSCGTHFVGIANIASPRRSAWRSGFEFLHLAADCPSPLFFLRLLNSDA